jgi:hypothetical protein
MESEFLMPAGRLKQFVQAVFVAAGVTLPPGTRLKLKAASEQFGVPMPDQEA